MQKEGFVLLYDIGVISQEILSFRRQAKELPKEIKELSTDIDKTKVSIESNRANIEKFEDEIREVSLTREDIKSSLINAENKVPTISNNEEYDFVYKEISNFKGKLKSLGNKLSVLEADKTALENETNELLETLEAKIQEFSPEINEKQKQLDSLESKILKKQKSISKEVTKLEKASPRIAKVYKKLDKVSNGKVSIGFVDVNAKTSHCSHCFSILPLQQKAAIRDNKAICICENCSSMLVSTVYSKNVKNSETEAVEA